MDMKSKEIRHYFVTTEHEEKDFIKFNYEIDGVCFNFTTSPDVFCKNHIDEGSEILIRTILKNKEKYKGNILDICCGYGAIGLILDKFLDANIEMCDINSMALKLASINVTNNCSKVTKIFESDMWSTVIDKYDHIISNPPIKVGKKVLLELINNAQNYLKSGGDITIVIKKNLGADSTKKYLIQNFGNCDIMKRDKGYYILHSTKE